jgi:hypothetical protein
MRVTLLDFCYEMYSLHLCIQIEVILYTLFSLYITLPKNTLKTSVHLLISPDVSY